MKKSLFLLTVLSIGSMDANSQRLAGRVYQNQSSNYFSYQILAPIITALFISAYLYRVSESGTSHMSMIEHTQALMKYEKQQAALKRAKKP